MTHDDARALINETRHTLDFDTYRDAVEALVPGLNPSPEFLSASYATATCVGACVYVLVSCGI